jgi:hypothetical protein
MWTVTLRLIALHVGKKVREEVKVKKTDGGPCMSRAEGLDEDGKWTAAGVEFM